MTQSVYVFYVRNQTPPTLRHSRLRHDMAPQQEVLKMVP